MNQKQSIQSLLATENSQLRKLHTIVEHALKEEELIMQHLKSEDIETLSFSQRISDKVARFGGSWSFIIMFCMVLAAWIVYNVSVVVTKRFDPYPFILMNLILSCIAALQAPIIMMSQNRKEEKDRQRAENDYMVNLKAEIEVRNLHEKMNLLLNEQFKLLMDIQAQQIKILNEVDRKISSASQKNINH